MASLPEKALLPSEPLSLVEGLAELLQEVERWGTGGQEFFKFISSTYGWNQGAVGVSMNLLEKFVIGIASGKLHAMFRNHLDSPGTLADELASFQVGHFFHKRRHNVRGIFS